MSPFLIFLLLLRSSCSRDTDGDGIHDHEDSCPFDRNNDLDNDNLCAIDSCRDDPIFVIPLIGAKCDFFGPEKMGYGKCKQYEKNGIASNVCSSCACACANEVACGFDQCPNDAQNDADKDGICGDVDSCPFDKMNDADSDKICGDVDTCGLDFENDADNDKICGDVDECPHDAKNDADNDKICGNEDSCPFDSANDIDNDMLCSDKDSCPADQYNDADSDNMCALKECYDNPTFVSAYGYTCAEYASQQGYCKADSTVSLNVCTACSCACADEPACRFDKCPHDAGNDSDDDNICGDVDPCPVDKENDADSDNLCADKDVCPNDASNDVDSDKICGQVDSCPMDHENDADGDNMCAEKDQCPLDPDNDADGDMLCAGTLILHASINFGG